MNRIVINISLLLSIVLLGQCKQSYVSPYKSPATGYLVVEGFIAGGGPTSFTLSRTIGLTADSAIPYVSGAQVRVEGNDGSAYPLAEQQTGVYGGDTLPLNPTAQYRLRIALDGGKQYLSSYVPFKSSPPIDSISWVNQGGAVQIYANTHDPSNNSRYYQWTFVETWQYNSAEQSELIFDPVNTVVNYRTPAQQVYNCWHNIPSTAIYIGSTAKLAQDVMTLAPLSRIPPNSEQISVLYTIYVTQYALTEDGYNFLSLMQKNTEQLGSIFDAQPSQTKGNIQCLNDPTEQVVGFVSAGTAQHQRIFISRFDVPSTYVFLCPLKDTIVPPRPDTMHLFFDNEVFVPVMINLTPAGPYGWFANYGSCVDCTLRGGTTTKPSFWPN